MQKIVLQKHFIVRALARGQCPQKCNELMPAYLLLEDQRCLVYMNKSIAILLPASLWICINAAFCEGVAKWQGYVIDKQCADSVREDSNPISFIQHHTRDCSLMSNCRALGYCLYSNGKWLDFDKKGNELAIKLLQASKKKSGVFSEATGILEGKVLKVQAMKEVAEPSRQEEAK